MKFTIDKTLLFKGVNKVVRAIKRDPKIPALQGILFEAINNSLRLTATDLSTTIQHIIPDVEIIRHGRVLINGKFLNDLLRKLTGVITIETLADQRAWLLCGDLDARIIAIDPDEFPEMSGIPEQTTITLPLKTLKTAINKTVFATAHEDIRPIFTGILFETGEGFVNLVATDTHRLSKISCPVDSKVSLKSVIPADAMKELVRSFDGETVSMQFNDGFAVFDCDYTRIITKFVYGQFPNYEAIMPKDPIAKLSIGKVAFKAAIERANLFCDKYNRIVKFNGGDNLSVSGSSGLFGEVRDVVKTDHEGEEIKISFNAEFLLQSLNAISGDKIVFNYFGPFQAVTIIEDGYVQLILPVRTE